MRLVDDPGLRTPDRQLTELAGMLSTGILRLHEKEALPKAAKNCPTSEILANSSVSGLELSYETVLSVDNG